MFLVHLLRELETTVKYKQQGEGWNDFEEKLRGIFGESIRLWKKRDEIDDVTLIRRRERLDERLAELIETDWNDKHSDRLVKHLRRHQNDLFTVLYKDGVPFDNNHAERTIRLAVILRKNSYSNRSEQGSDCQATLISIFRTLKQRRLDPLGTIITATQDYLKTGKLPPLPQRATLDG